MSYFRIPKDAMEVFIDAKKRGAYPQNEVLHESNGQYIRRVFPKLLGSLLILVAAFAVNHTFTEVYRCNIVYGGNLSFYIFIALFVLLLHQGVSSWISRQLSKYPKIKKYGPVVLASLCITVIIILGLFNKGGTKGDSVRLFYAILSLTILFLVLSLSYNQYVLWLKQKIGGKLIVIFIIFILFSYLLLFFKPTALEDITPISIVMICLIGIYTLLNIVKILGRVINLPLLGIVTIVAIGLAIYNAGKENFNHYEASSTIDVKNKPSDRLTLKVYSDQWVSDRLKLIKSQKDGDQFPIILVSAEGGGSRAGLWSFLVQSYLFDKDSDYFEKYLFAITGASGGGVGNNMFYVQADELLINPKAKPFKYSNWSPKYSCDNDTLGFKYKASKIYNNDYLSSSVASLFGRDLFKSITDIWIDFEDRGKLLENKWERAFKTAFERNDNPLAEAYLDIMPQKGKYKYIRPLLITNTTELQSGERVVISPVSISEDINNMAVFKDLLAIYPDENRMIKRSTAMSMNARFPYVSPAARITGLGQFGDAGYYNNIGGEVTERLENALLKSLELATEKDSTLKGKYVIKHLLITNYEKHSKLTYSSQLLAPASIIASATFAHPKQSEKTFTNLIDIESKRIKIPVEESTGITKWVQSLVNSANTKTDSIEPVIPLGRYMSRAAVRALEYRLDDKELKECLDEVLKKRAPYPLY